MNNWKQKLFLPMLLMFIFPVQAMQSTRYKRYELVLALQRHFSSGCVVWQLLQEHDYSIQRKWNIVQLQKFLWTTDVLSTVVNSGVLPCPRNKPLYVIWSSGDADGQRYLQQLFSEFHSSDVRWLLFMDNTSVSIEDFLGAMNIPFDCEFLVAVESQGIMELSEMYRVHDSLPLVMSRWGSWRPDDGLTAPALSLLRRRNDLQGICFVIAGLQVSPLVYVDKEDSDGRVEAKGYPIEIWNELSKRLNFSIITRRPPDLSYGFQLPNGSWNGILGMIMDGTANASFSPFTLNTFSFNAVDHTTPVFILWYDVFVRTRYNSDHSWEVYMTPFTLNLWLTVAATIMVIICLQTVMFSFLAKEDIFSFQDTFFSVLGSFCSQGMMNISHRPSLRLVVWVTFLTGLVVLSSYGARIISSLAVKTPTLPFKNFQGLLNDKSYGFGVHGRTGISQLYRESGGVWRDIYYQKLLPELHNLPMSNEEGFQRACNKKYAYLCSRTFAVPGTTPCHLTILPEASTPKPTGFILPKRSPYRRIINYTLQRMLGSGISRKLQLQWLVFPDDVEPPPMRKVELNDVKVLLLLCVVGGGVSISVFVVEKFISLRRYHKVSVYNKRC